MLNPKHPTTAMHPTINLIALSPKCSTSTNCFNQSVTLFLSLTDPLMADMTNPKIIIKIPAMNVKIVNFRVWNNLQPHPEPEDLFDLEEFSEYLSSSSSSPNFGSSSYQKY